MIRNCMPGCIQIHTVIFMTQKVPDAPDIAPRHAGTQDIGLIPEPNSCLADLLEVTFNRGDTHWISTKPVERNPCKEFLDQDR